LSKSKSKIVHLTAATESLNDSLKYDSSHKKDTTVDQLFQLSNLKEILIFSKLADKYKLSILIELFHHNLVTLPSHHSKTANALFHSVLTVSQLITFFLFSIFKGILFKVAFQFIKITYESLLTSFSDNELNIQNKIIDIIIRIIKIINLLFINLE